ncbi:MAG: DUF3800 domain-containing protein [Anaerovoracaceae bacterium]|nr:DUF3800 domain-containing protein [Anaerovoracaceae bacterium]
MEYNIYCDESCHLLNDNINDMVLGAVWCPKEKVKEISDRIKQIKKKNGVNSQSEIKWTKISPVKERLYSDIIDYFFDDDDLRFRGVLIPDKSILKHEKFNQTHDEWYYKMYFNMLKTIFSIDDKYNIYIDIKDTYSYRKAQKLREVCQNSIYDFSGKQIKKIQPIRSHEVQIIQLADVLIGAVCYNNRDWEGVGRSKTKIKIIEQIKERSGYSLTKSTLYREEKFNMLRWESNYEQ